MLQPYPLLKNEEYEDLNMNCKLLFPSRKNENVFQDRNTRSLEGQSWLIWTPETILLEFRPHHWLEMDLGLSQSLSMYNPNVRPVLLGCVQLGTCLFENSQGLDITLNTLTCWCILEILLCATFWQLFTSNRCIGGVVVLLHALYICEVQPGEGCIEFTTVAPSDAHLTAQCNVRS